MLKKVNVLLLAVSIVLSSIVTANAGILQNLDDELTGLVKKTEPFLVTVESRGSHLDLLLVGTGVVIDKEGYILTTTSVATEDDDITVTFKDGKSYPADFIGADGYSGLAMLKIKPVDREIPKAGDAYKLKEGSWVTVIGNSYDMPSSVNFGIFSGITDEGLLQLSVATSPGSSGGAVFNTKGELIGILVAKATETVSAYIPNLKNLTVKAYSSATSRAGGFHEVGVDLPSSATSLAVPIDKVLMVAEQLKKYGEVRRGFLGISQRRLSEREMKRHDIDGGVYVTDVSIDSPAYEAGLGKRDIILKFDGVTVKNPGHLYGLVRSHLPGDKVNLEILRGDSTIDVKVTLGEVSDNKFFASWEFPWIHSIVDDLKVDVDISDLQKKLEDMEKRLQKLFEKIEELDRRMR